MTLREACIEASRRLGMTEEVITKCTRINELDCPGLGNEQIPPGQEDAMIMAAQKLMLIFTVMPQHERDQLDVINSPSNN